MKDQPIRKLVYASSSSVYGNARLPMRETAQPRPVSPYGVSKLAAEQLCAVYHAAYGLPTISLRFFTVYGPRQRPDMAFHRFIQAAIAGMAVPVYGDGRQSRDFTFVDDVVTATIQAALIPQTGIVINVASGTPVTILEVIAALQDALERRVPVSHLPAQAGDLPHTTADSRRACRLLDFQPGVTIVEGLNRQVAWQLALRRSALAGSAL